MGISGDISQNAGQADGGARLEHSQAWRVYGPIDLPRPHLAALDQFVQFGYHGTSIRRIATAAGMTVPGLYYHFESKDEILATLLLDAMHDVVDRGNAAVASVGENARERFAVQVENFCLHTMYRREAAFLMRELRFLEEPNRSKVIALRDDLEQRFYADLDQAASDGAFDVADRRAAGRAVLALTRSIAQWYSPTGPDSPEAITAQYVSYALRIVGDRA